MDWKAWKQELADLTPEERVEVLIELSNQLPGLSSARAATPFPETCRVQECQTPVYLWIDVAEGRVSLEADVPRKSPTVRGLVTLVIDALQGASVEEVLSLPTNLLEELGLGEALGMTRQQGFRGVIMRIKQAAQTSPGDP